ncbi:MAG: sensor histidine kinase, partial [Planctomycetota bacterium]
LTKKALNKAVTNFQRASMVMQSILAVANGQTDEKIEVGLAKIIDEIFTCLCRDFSKDSITLQIDIADDLKIFAIPIQIQQVMMNLIIKARDAMADRGGVLQIKADSLNNGVRIEVSDSGCGIEPKDTERIFEPFFSTKKDQSPANDGGYGLGLAFCKKVIDEHQGLIEVDSEPGQGCKFTITLPGC